MNRFVQKRNMYIVFIVLIGFASSCIYKNERFQDGDTWVVRSTFVLKCKVTSNGWTTTVIGCKTPGGVVVEPGKIIREGDTTYECISMGNGRVEIKRTYNFNPKHASCEGHGIGESWVSQHNFRKTCTEKGAQISECLTDAGISVPLNQNLILSGIVYTCTQHPNGTVTINREGVPSPNNFKNNNLLQTPSESDKKPLVISPTTETIEGPNSIQNKITCISKGVVYKPEETWISDNKFTKKCTPDGSVIILNCLMDDKTTINVNTELKLGKNTYKCYRSKEEGHVYFEVITE